jgi:hypothetical protein
MKRLTALLMTFVLAFLLAGCGGGGGSASTSTTPVTTVTGVATPGAVSVVTAK